MAPFISFLSDFGRDDEFVGVVHGVIARLAPDVSVIDVTHAIRPGDIRGGALALTRAIQYLPDGVILAVVDPGVGTERRAIAARTPIGLFVGPDNGLLGPAVAMVGGADRIVAIENPEMRIPATGETFHGRDVFGPAAALLASGEASLDDCGADVAPDSVVPLLLPLAEVSPGRITATAWWVDRFGNAQTNVSPEEMALAGISHETTVTVQVGSTDYEVPWVTAYADVDEGDLLLHVDGSGLIALAVRGGSAAENLRLGEGQPVTLKS
ncbi:MAG TPA: SAM-dependent chlorinase/fluorinase [Acidimicrobiia bacterium]|nr:SAM-dependent chlorinase/fluorinase [Acidimicrobiia bacterium]